MRPNNMVIIPNNKLSQSIVTNYYLPEKSMALSTPFQRQLCFWPWKGWKGPPGGGPEGDRGDFQPPCWPCASGETHPGLRRKLPRSLNRSAHEAHVKVEKCHEECRGISGFSETFCHSTPPESLLILVDNDLVAVTGWGDWDYYMGNLISFYSNSPVFFAGALLLQ